jgi:ubiquinone/menaquinone biosynthesis C-methylase UbiE
MYPDILGTIAGEAGDTSGKQVLDLGCGTGNLIALLLERSPGVKIVGVDPSAGMREVCAERFKGLSNVEIKDGDALSIPFPEGSFDLIVSSLALHHVPPDLKPSCAAELARVLMPGGKFIHADPFCGVPGPDMSPEKTRDIIERMVAKVLYSLEHGAQEMMMGELEALPLLLREEGEYMVTVEEWTDVLREAGFTAFRVIDIPPVDLMKIVCFRLGGD